MSFLLNLLVLAFTLGQVSEINQTQYLGRWHQVYSDLFVDATFKNSSFCHTAEYELNRNNTNITGSEHQVFGWAKPDEITVHLQTAAPFEPTLFVLARRYSDQVVNYLTEQGILNSQIVTSQQGCEQWA